MPQTNVLQDWKNTYPLDAPCQKPGGVAISTTLWAHAVPNKPQWTGTQGLMAEPSVEQPHEESQKDTEEESSEETESEETEHEETEEDENGEPRPRRGRRRR